MLSGLSKGAVVAFIAQLAIALLFLVWGWGETYANGLGRSPALRDILVLCVPIAFLAIATAAAAAMGRSGRAGPELAIALSPMPVTVVLALAGGLVL